MSTDGCRTGQEDWELCLQEGTWLGLGLLDRRTQGLQGRNQSSLTGLGEQGLNEEEVAVTAVARTAVGIPLPAPLCHSCVACVPQPPGVALGL